MRADKKQELILLMGAIVIAGCVILVITAIALLVLNKV
jgi:hypothetical protein